MIVALAVVLGIVAANTGGGSSDQYVTDLQTALTELPSDMANGTKLGSDSAPLKLTEYEDFQCPFCLKYSASQEPTLVNEYVKTGKMQITYENLPDPRKRRVRQGGDRRAVRRRPGRRQVLEVPQPALHRRSEGWAGGRGEDRRGPL